MPKFQRKPAQALATKGVFGPLVALLLLAAPTAAAAQGGVFVVRHAERADTSADSVLSAAGQARAMRLAVILKDAGITQIFTTNLRRTVQTAEPLAVALRLTPTELPGNDLDALLTKFILRPDETGCSSSAIRTPFQRLCVAWVSRLLSRLAKSTTTFSL